MISRLFCCCLRKGRLSKLKLNEVGIKPYEMREKSIYSDPFDCRLTRLPSRGDIVAQHKAGDSPAGQKSACARRRSATGAATSLYREVVGMDEPTERDVKKSVEKKLTIRIALRWFAVTMIAFWAIILLRSFFLGLPYGADSGVPVRPPKNQVQYFKTCTVEFKLNIDSGFGPKFLGYTSDELSNKALDVVNASLHKRFANLTCTRYGQPVSYKTNPLNVSIYFELLKTPGANERAELAASIERAFFFHAFMWEKETNNKPLEGRPLKDEDISRIMLAPYGNKRIIIGRNVGLQEVDSEEKLKKMVELYAEDITKVMVPDVNEAEEAEIEILNKLKFKE